MSKPVSVRPITKAAPELRKLARALLLLAEEKPSADSKPTSRRKAS